MRNLLLLVICLAVPATSCDRETRSFSTILPTTPTAAPISVPGPPVPGPPGQQPSPYPGSPFSEIYTPITVGELVVGRVKSNDPLCIGEPLWPCQYFRVTVPTDGVLEIVLTVLPSMRRANRPFLHCSGFDGMVGASDRPGESGRDLPNHTLGYEFPGAEFELRTTLREN